MKRTKLDKQLNRAIVLVLGMLFCVCLVGVIGMALNVTDNLQHDYLQWTDSAPVAVILNFLTYLILFSGMVPISLYVSVEMVKVVHALLIDNDVKMYHAASDTPAKAKTSALSEELGQISYIFSDKTGTLTRNEMEFKKCCVGGKSYGLMEEEAKGVAPLSSAVDPEFGFRDKDIERDLVAGPNARLLHEFMTALSVCHTVLVEQEKGRYHYNAESPDEAALVEAAAQFGWTFAERVTTAEGSFLTVRTNFMDGRESTRREPLRYLLLNVIEFNSTRKRMSVVVREMFGAKRLILMCKGADNVITSELILQVLFFLLIILCSRLVGARSGAGWCEHQRARESVRSDWTENVVYRTEGSGRGLVQDVERQIPRRFDGNRQQGAAGGRGVRGD